MLRFMTTALVAAVLIVVVRPASAQDDAVDFTARGGVKDLIGRVEALEAGVGDLADAVQLLKEADAALQAAINAEAAARAAADAGLQGQMAGLQAQIDDLRIRIEALESAAPGPEKFIFVTTLASKGNKGGLTGADSTCQSEAEANSLPGAYKAWLSITLAGPQTTFMRAMVPYVLPGSLEVVANDWIGLTSGALAHAIDRHADGGLIDPVQEFWTGTTANGLPSLTDTAVTLQEQAIIHNCVGWFAEIPERSGTVGTSGAVDSSWSDFTERTCDNELRHICVQQ
jgi:hypothetical protein